MNVLHTIASLSRASGGPSRTVSNLCSYLGYADISVTVATIKDKGANGGAISPDADVVEVLTQSSKKIPVVGSVMAKGFESMIERTCKDKSIQIMHDHGVWLRTNHITSLVAKKYGIPLVVSPRGMLEPWALKHKRWKKMIAWHLWQLRDLKRVSAFCATAESEAMSIRRLGFRQPIAVIPNGVEIPRWEEIRSERIKGRHRALFLSRVHQQKGVCELIEAWGKVQPPGWDLLIAGHGERDYVAKVRRTIRKAELDHVVTMIGPVEGIEKWNLYRESDLFILPTYSENYGLVVAEALAAGTPVITTKGAPWKSLEEQGCGWWIEMGEESLRKAIYTATSVTDGERRKMGENGRKFVAREFSWYRIARQMVQFYKWLLGHIAEPEGVIIR